MTKIVFRSDLENINLVDEFTAQIKRRYLIDNQKIMDIRLSIMEAVNNAIIHGNQMDASKSVHISEEMENNFLVIRIEDQGRGFDPSTIEDPTCQEDLSLPGGRGIHLMRHLSDQIDYLQNGQSVLLRFKL